MFSVELPQAAPQAGGRARRPSRRPLQAALPGLKVLCIDNEPDVLNGMQALLEGWGCMCHDRAERGRGHRRSCGGRGDMPDIILADFHLDGGTGLEAVAAVHARDADRRSR